MSTLRVSNIEAKSDPSSSTADEQVKITNSNGDVLLYVDGRTSGITTVGINTTAQSFEVDSNNNFNLTGIVTATSFSGPLTGNVTGTATQLATNATGANLTLTGNLGVGGTITYEDVARVDATGISTFREGFKVGPLTGIALTAYTDGSIRTTGIITASTFGSDTNSIFTTGGTERVRIDSNGKVLIGTTNVPSNKNTVTPSLNVSGSGVLGAAQITRHTGVGGGGALLHLAGTRGSDVNSYTILQNNDGIGTLAFNAADGNEFVTAAEISAQVDGTPGDNDMPGRLLFKTTADGASSPTERMRIDKDGNVTKPTNFWINVRRSGNQTGYNANNTTDVIVWNNIQNGSTGHASHFDTSTGLFTAPVTGMYHFHVAVNCNFDVEGSWLVVNGSRAYWSAFYPNNTASADGSIFYPITAGQTVGIKWYKNNSSSVTINANDHHTWWRIVLLG